jgi:nitrite reductase (NADH) small subunit
MPLLKVSAIDELPSGAIKEIEAGETSYAVCNVEGKLHCVEGICPHAGGPLGQGTLNGNYIVCPWHGFEFDCRTGLNEDDEDMRVQTFAVTVQDGQILIDLP